MQSRKSWSEENECTSAGDEESNSLFVAMADHLAEGDPDNQSVPEQGEVNLRAERTKYFGGGCALSRGHGSPHIETRVKDQLSLE
ncbi:hypothetical protein OPT61_g1077 [Boeremia exigua]|uniref:Uncharacterized protein n=1 Tax=Boeremia exigua TaxID=749465 RepID=A0ACC2IRV7_9PLEO|nr:hypothetical protein OPT61_g1077 [Boeremia exigua]